MNWDNGHLSDISDIFRTFIGHTTKAQNLSSKETLMNFKYKKPQMNTDKRRLITSVHRKGSKEREAIQNESLCPSRSLRLNVFSAPAHGRAPPSPAVHLRLSRAGG